MQKKENGLYSVSWRAEQRLSSLAQILCFGWKRALAAELRGCRGVRDLLVAPLGGSESRHTKALLKNHCSVARSLFDPPERHFLCSLGRGQSSTQGQSSGDHTARGIVQNTQPLTSVHHFPGFRFFQRQTSCKS